MRLSHALLMLLLATVMAACGDDTPAKPAAEEDPEGLPGTYLLDAAAWRTAAESDATRWRMTDLMNLAQGADPYFGVEPAKAKALRPKKPKELRDMSDAEKEAFEAAALAFIRAEAPELNETLALNEDGTFVLTHASRCADGGSLSLGIFKRLVMRGSWELKGDALTLRAESSTNALGQTWSVKPSHSQHAARVTADGVILLKPNWRDGLRAFESVYRPK